MAGLPVRLKVYTIVETLNIETPRITHSRHRSSLITPLEAERPRSPATSKQFCFLLSLVGDAHTNSCENRHRFLRNWLRRFQGISKHHLQGYLNFLGWILNTNDWLEQILSTDFYR